MEILCDNPVYILNPNIRSLLIKSRRYVWKDKVYYVDDKLYQVLCNYVDSPLALYKKHKENLKNGIPSRFRSTSIPLSYFPDRFSKNGVDDLENTCYIVLPDGDCVGIYIPVPCGKCIVCIDKRQREMSTRCMCESLYSKSHPLFVTLTFNDKNLPTDGVCKEHLQKFFKRLRRRLEYYYNHIGIRYFAVPEYGEDERYTHRPHYHLILWNMPTLVGSEEEVNHFNLCLFKQIEKAWSFEIDETSWQKLPPSYRFYEYRKKRKDSKKETRVYYERLGIAQCEFARDKTGRYCTGYMQKGQASKAPAPYKNDCNWYLSSRGNGGLGKQWILDNAELYRKNLNLTSCEFSSDNGKTFHMTMPKYFLNILFPSRSKIVSKECYIRLQRFNYNVNLMNACINYLIQKNEHINYSFKMSSKIYEKFKFIELIKTPTPLSFFSGFELLDSEYVLHILHEAHFEYTQDVAFLYQYKLHSFDLEGFNLKNKRSDILNVLSMTTKRNSLNKVKDNIISKHLLREYRKKLLVLQ